MARYYFMYLYVHPCDYANEEHSVEAVGSILINTSCFFFKIGSYYSVGVGVQLVYALFIKESSIRLKLLTITTDIPEKEK